MREYVQRADMDKSGPCHHFRHACATLMREGRADTPAVNDAIEPAVNGQEAATVAPRSPDVAADALFVALNAEADEEATDAPLGRARRAQVGRSRG